MSVPRISRVNPLPPGRLSVEWDDGSVTMADLSDLLSDPVFEALRDPATFSAVQVVDWGCTLEWPDGSDLSFRNIWQRSHRAAA